MALIIEDRVKETATTTGTGAFTLAGAVAGFVTFASVCSTNDTVYYAIEAVDGSGNPTGDWECGLGTYSGTNTLTRTTVQRSSNSNAAVSFSAGTKRVFLSATQAYLALLAKLAGPTFTGTVGVSTVGSGTWNGSVVGAQYGGTGAATLTAHGVVIGNGTSPVAITSAGTSGQVLTSNGASADPTFQVASGGGTVYSDATYWMGV